MSEAEKNMNVNTVVLQHWILLNKLFDARLHY